MNEEPAGYSIYRERRSWVAYRNSARLISSINQYQAFLVWADILNQSVSGLPSVGWSRLIPYTNQDLSYHNYPGFYPQ
jgi:hypothetical protein